jgi:tripartite-type tricarboxylate transporter receptor subunit TctC
MAQKRFTDLGVDAVGSNPAELDKFVKVQLAFNKAIIEKAKISVGE